MEICFALLRILLQISCSAVVRCQSRHENENQEEYLLVRLANLYGVHHD
jgi:hypothetical protein